MAVSRLRLHRSAARVGLHAAFAAATALVAVWVHPYVADLAGRTAADPLLAVEDEPAAHARSPEHAEDRLVGLAGAEPELGLGCHRHVIAEEHACAQLLLELGPEWERVAEAGKVRRIDEHALVGIDTAGRANADTDQRIGREAGLVRRRANRLRDRPHHGLRPVIRGGRHARLAQHLAAPVDHDDLDLGPPKVDACAWWHGGEYRSG